jgi:hypothetical protein
MSWKTLSQAHVRYAYFKKLTYFSTECIYSPDGKLTCIFSRLSANSSLSRTRPSLPERSRSGQAERNRRYHPFRGELLAGADSAEGHQGIALAIRNHLYCIQLTSRDLPEMRLHVVQRPLRESFFSRRHR